MLQMKKNILEANLINVIDKNIFKTFVYDWLCLCHRWPQRISWTNIQFMRNKNGKLVEKIWIKSAWSFSWNDSLYFKGNSISILLSEITGLFCRLISINEKDCKLHALPELQITSNLLNNWRKSSQVLKSIIENCIVKYSFLYFFKH